MVPQLVFADSVCSLNGEVIPCDAFWNDIGSRIVPFVIGFGFLGLLATIFWLVMIIHAIGSPIENKLVWLIILFLTGFLGAIVYYVIIKRPMNKAKINDFGPVAPPGHNTPNTPPPPQPPVFK